MTVVFLTTGSSSPWSRPVDWTDALHQVELVGAGGQSGAAGSGATTSKSGAGGAGGCYAKLNTPTGSLGSTTPFAVPGNNTHITYTSSASTLWEGTSSTNTYEAKAGFAGSTVTGGTSPGFVTNGTPSPVTYATSNKLGGSGGTTGTSLTGGGGGGGAAGPQGVGGGGGTSGTAAFGGGGGGASNITNAGGNAASGTGATGGVGQGATNGGGAGSSSATTPNGSDGTGGHGGGGGAGSSATSGALVCSGFNGGTLGNTSDWVQSSDSSHAGAGAGGGGGGGVSGNGTETATSNGGTGALYGGGGGGAGAGRVAITQAVGTGGAGLIVITYTAAAVGTNLTILIPARIEMLLAAADKDAIAKAEILEAARNQYRDNIEALLTAKDSAARPNIEALLSARDQDGKLVAELTSNLRGGSPWQAEQTTNETRLGGGVAAEALLAARAGPALPAEFRSSPAPALSALPLEALHGVTAASASTTELLNRAQAAFPARMEQLVGVGGRAIPPIEALAGVGGRAIPPIEFLGSPAQNITALSLLQLEVLRAAATGTTVPVEAIRAALVRSGLPVEALTARAGRNTSPAELLAGVATALARSPAEQLAAQKATGSPQGEFLHAAPSSATGQRLEALLGARGAAGEPIEQVLAAKTGAPSQAEILAGVARATSAALEALRAQRGGGSVPVEELRSQRFTPGPLTEYLIGQRSASGPPLEQILSVGPRTSAIFEFLGQQVFPLTALSLIQIEVVRGVAGRPGPLVEQLTAARGGIPVPMEDTANLTARTGGALAEIVRGAKATAGLLVEALLAARRATPVPFEFLGSPPSSVTATASAPIEVLRAQTRGLRVPLEDTTGVQRAAGPTAELTAIVRGGFVSPAEFSVGGRVASRIATEMLSTGQATVRIGPMEILLGLAGHPGFPFEFRGSVAASVAAFTSIPIEIAPTLFNIDRFTLLGLWVEPVPLTGVFRLSMPLNAQFVDDYVLRGVFSDAVAGTAQFGIAANPVGGFPVAGGFGGVGEAISGNVLKGTFQVTYPTKGKVKDK